MHSVHLSTFLYNIGHCKNLSHEYGRFLSMSVVDKDCMVAKMKALNIF